MLPSRYSIKEIKKLRLPKTESSLLNLLLYSVAVILTPLIILLGLVFMLVVLVSSAYDRIIGNRVYTNEQETLDIMNPDVWTVLIRHNNTVVFIKYAGEVRFGPPYFYIKTEPATMASGNIYGDWFYVFKNSIFLQQWC